MAKFSSHLSLRQTAYGVSNRTQWDFYVQPLTVGQIRIIETDPQCRPDYQTDALFQEVYMCVETGIGSGTLWEFGKNIFATEADAQAAVKAHEQRAHKQRLERDERLRLERERQEARDLAELKRLQEKYAAA